MTASPGKLDVRYTILNIIAQRLSERLTTFACEMINWGVQISGDLCGRPRQSSWTSNPQAMSRNGERAVCFFMWLNVARQTSLKANVARQSSLSEVGTKCQIKADLWSRKGERKAKCGLNVIPSRYSLCSSLWPNSLLPKTSLRRWKSQDSSSELTKNSGTQSRKSKIPTSGTTPNRSR